MLGKTSRPVMEILTGSLVTGSRTGKTGAKTRMESNNPATRGIKSFDLGGVGLGIVAAMEKSGAGRSDEVQANRVLVSRSLRRSVPNPVTQPRESHRRVMEERILQDYSNVNWRGPRVSSPKGYSEGGRKGDDRTPFRIQNGPKSRQASVFDISPARYREAAGAPPPDFLNSCCLCRKKLHGKDIYMYRGEKAFCSSECRYRQIVVDERREKCGSGASRSVEISNSPYSTGQAFNNNGILAA